MFVLSLKSFLLKIANSCPQSYNIFYQIYLEMQGPDLRLPLISVWRCLSKANRTKTGSINLFEINLFPPPIINFGSVISNDWSEFHSPFVQNGNISSLDDNSMR